MVKFDLKFEICDVKYRVKFGGKTFRPARTAPKISGRISGQISEKISETSFQISRHFSETSFSRRAVLKSGQRRVQNVFGVLSRCPPREFCTSTCFAISLACQRANFRPRPK